MIGKLLKALSRRPNKYSLMKKTQKITSKNQRP